MNRTKIALAPGSPLQKNIALQTGLTFSARVVDSLTAKPVEGLHLLGRDADFNAVSDKDGLIRILNLYRGPLHWDVQEKGPAKNIMRWWSEQAKETYQRKAIEEARGGWQRNFDGLDFEIGPDMAPVTIVAERGVRIRGRVLSPSGQSVAGATVAPALTGTGNSLTGDTRFSVLTDARGQYDGYFPAGGPRQWNLIAHDGDYGEWRRFANGSAAPLKTSPGQTIENYDLRLVAPVTVSGRVVNGAGKTVAGAEVRAVPADNRGNRLYDPTTKTDAKGDFALRFVAPGRHFVQVEPFWLFAKKAPAASTRIVEVKPGAPASVGTLKQVPIR